MHVRLGVLTVCSGVRRVTIVGCVLFRSRIRRDEYLIADRWFAVLMLLLFVTRVSDGCGPINAGGFAVTRPRLWGRLGFWRADNAAFTGNPLLAERRVAVADSRFFF